jgi:ribose transport system substrate-binding protein
VTSSPAIVAALLLSSLAATAARAEGERIAVFTKNGENPNYRAFLLGADRAAAGMGARTIPRFPKKADDPVEQTELLEAQLDERPDAILFNPADDQRLVAPLARITDAGIPVVGFVNRMSGRFVSFVGADDRALGYAAAEHLLAALDGRGSVVIIEGSAGATTARDRMTGFQQALAEAPGVTLLGSASGNYLKRGGLEAMTGLLEAHPAIDGVIAANDSMALGAIEAMAKAGRKAIIVGSNGTIEAAQAIAAGDLLATVDYNGFTMGCIATVAAIRHLRGQTVPSEIMLPTQVIDRGNFQAWLTPIEQRACPAWADVVKP